MWTNRDAYAHRWHEWSSFKFMQSIIWPSRCVDAWSSRQMTDRESSKSFQSDLSNVIISFMSGSGLWWSMGAKWKWKVHLIFIFLALFHPIQMNNSKSSEGNKQALIVPIVPSGTENEHLHHHGESPETVVMRGDPQSTRFLQWILVTIIPSWFVDRSTSSPTNPNKASSLEIGTSCPSSASHPERVGIWRSISWHVPSGVNHCWELTQAVARFPCGQRRICQWTGNVKSESQWKESQIPWNQYS
jgi:hypothetical protein